MRHNAMPVRPLVLPLALPFLTGCAPILQMMGSGGSIVQVAVHVDRLKLLGDGLSYASSNKTLTDHWLSRMTDQDCRVWNIATGTRVCVTKPPEVVFPTFTVVFTRDEDDLLATGAATASDDASVVTTAEAPPL